jgi:hypothetical protein
MFADEHPTYRSEPQNVSLAPKPKEGDLSTIPSDTESPKRGMFPHLFEFYFFMYLLPILILIAVKVLGGVIEPPTYRSELKNTALAPNPKERDLSINLSDTVSPGNGMFPFFV